METIRSKKLLILTDFSKHKEFETLYPLARGLATHKEISTVQVTQTDPRKPIDPSQNMFRVKVDDRFSIHTAQKQLQSQPLSPPPAYEGILIWLSQKPSGLFLNSLETAFPGSGIVGRNYPALLLPQVRGLRPGNRFFGVGKTIVGTIPAHFPASQLNFNLHLKKGWAPPEQDEVQLVTQWMTSAFPSPPDFFTLETARDPAGNPMIRRYWPNQLINLYPADITSGKFMVREAAEHMSRLLLRQPPQTHPTAGADLAFEKAEHSTLMA